MKSLIALSCVGAVLAQEGSSTATSSGSTPANTDVPQTQAPGGNGAQSNCTALRYVYARGTAEPATPFGIALGDPLFNAIKQLVPDLSGYGVRYPANLDCNSRQTGGDDAVAHLNSQHALCPNQKFVLAGQSQGADVIRFAAAEAPTDLYPSIIAIVLFGDPGHRGQDAVNPLGANSPDFPSELAARLKESCAHNDPICTRNGTIVGQHLIYANANETYIADSARYIQRQFESDGQAGPEPSPEGPGDQVRGNVDAIFQLSGFLAAAGIEQTCNGVTTSYIHPELAPTPAPSESSSAALAASTTTTGSSAASSSAAADNGAGTIVPGSLWACGLLATVLLAFN